MTIVNNKLSDHFSLRELTHSAVAVRHGLDNIPTVREVANLTNLTIHVLEPVRTYFNIPFRPTSGYRNLAVNKLVGSKPSSQHITGHAADFEIPTIANFDLAHWIKDNLEFDQLILEFYQKDNPVSGWVHCSYVAGHNRKMSLIFDGKRYKEF
ncbi:MAG: hypothetical protein K9G26_10215 [Emcibacter sp.]|nr:hypothetical protein [Emcibacter sp.]